MKYHVYYHAGCSDGACSAWVLYRYLCDVLSVDENLLVLHPVFHHDPLDEPGEGDSIWCLDYAPSNEVLLAWAEKAHSVTVYDHHASVIAQLEGVSHPRLVMVLDTTRSGAGITWDELFPREKRPDLVSYVEDRDLWRFALPQSREITAWTMTLPTEINKETVDTWEGAAVWAFATRFDFERLVAKGQAILSTHQDLVSRACRHTVMALIEGHSVPTVCSPLLPSETAHELLNRYPDAAFSVVWHPLDQDRVYLSFRSEDHRADVSKIALSMGGGGHRNSAGARLPFVQWLDLWRGGLK